MYKLYIITLRSGYSARHACRYSLGEQLIHWPKRQVQYTVIKKNGRNREGGREGG